MTFTYLHYLFNDKIETYVTRGDIQIIEVVKKMTLGAIVHFTCENENVLKEIFGE